MAHSPISMPKVPGWYLLLVTGLTRQPESGYAIDYCRVAAESDGGEMEWVNHYRHNVVAWYELPVRNASSVTFGSDAMSFFVDCGDGVKIYDTEHEARGAAQKALDGWRDCCNPEWPEEVERVCWGEIRECVVPVPKGDNDEYVDYELLDVRGIM